MKIYTNNTSGVSGIHWDNTYCRWIATVYQGGHKIWRKSFRYLDDAIRARQEVTKGMSAECNNHE